MTIPPPDTQTNPPANPATSAAHLPAPMHDFAQRARDAQRVLVIEFGGLGDHLHSLPALWMLRQNCRQARITLLVGGGGVAVFEGLAPWIDEVWGYSKNGLRSDRAWIRRLRQARFDVGIQLMQSNRGTALLALSGAKLKLARRTDENKPWWWQPLFIHQTVDEPYHQDPMYLQRWRCLQQAGFLGTKPNRLAAGHAHIDLHLRRNFGISDRDDGRYLHLSASATDDLRDLPAAQMIELWEALHHALPAYKWVVSCSDTPRGHAKLNALLGALSFTPWKVFAGNLNIAAFASVVQGAALHVGPDSGGLHIARIAGTPSVSWFRPNHHLPNWFPNEPNQLAFTAPESRPDGLYGLPTETLVNAAVSLIDQPPTEATG